MPRHSRRPPPASAPGAGAPRRSPPSQPAGQVQGRPGAFPLSYKPIGERAMVTARERTSIRTAVEDYLLEKQRSGWDDPLVLADELLDIVLDDQRPV